jgi:hypothetical protein
MKHENGMKLKVLILSRNNLKDNGIYQLSLGLFEKYTILENQNNSFSAAILPIDVLEIAETHFSDNVI